MSVSLMQLRRLVRSRIGVPQSDQFMRDDVIDDHVNLALDVVSSEHNWPWDEAKIDTTIDDGTLTPPLDWRTTRSLWVDDVELRNVASGDLITATGWTVNTDPSMQPSAWAEIGDQLYCRPAATGSIPAVMVYYRKVTPLTKDEDKLRMPDQYAGAIVAKASELLALREDQPAAAERHAAEYVQWINRMRRALRRTTGPVTPRIREGSWI